MREYKFRGKRIDNRRMDIWKFNYVKVLKQ